MLRLVSCVSSRAYTVINTQTARYCQVYILFATAIRNITYSKVTVAAKCYVMLRYYNLFRFSL
jgi:hypothetical protein